MSYSHIFASTMCWLIPIPFGWFDRSLTLSRFFEYRRLCDRWPSKLFVYCHIRSGLIDGLWTVGVATGLIPSGTTNGAIDLRYFGGRLPWLFGAPFGFNRGRPGPRRDLFDPIESFICSELSWLLFTAVDVLASARVNPPRFEVRDPRGRPLRRTGCFRYDWFAKSSAPYNCELEFEMLSQSTMIDSLPDS